MLILTRRVGESIVIGDGDNAVTVHVLESRGSNQLRIGIDAPRSMPVYRSELYKPGIKSNATEEGGHG